MSATIWLLPDFIGHPLCFSALAARLARSARLRHVSYHRYWPYRDIGQLARAIADDWHGERPQWLAGYSFGGLVACELASLLERRASAAGEDAEAVAPKLLLIDSRLAHGETAVARSGATTLAKLVGTEAYRQLVEKIDALAALDEIDRDCVEANLGLFPDFRPGVTTVEATLLTGRSGDEGYKTAERWSTSLPNLRRHRVDVAHQDMLTEAAALDTVLSILEAKEEA
ncbi:thioesterase domain-containing protein [Burkholderia plantarii]|uniref:thioesterase domain-containing protein n=1 Tax=Burkholderia plantarii TaxID=41899 RepID=UPI0008706C7F|nr:thioesterase domain-containing protein [Burkholderia plantarii]